MDLAPTILSVYGVSDKGLYMNGKRLSVFSNLETKEKGIEKIKINNSVRVFVNEISKKTVI